MSEIDTNPGDHESDLLCIAQGNKIPNYAASFRIV